TVLIKLTKALLEISNKQIPNELINNIDLFNNLKYQNTHLKVAKTMLANSGNQISIILGGLSISHPEYSNIIAVCKIISWITGANFGCFSYGANSLGAHLMDCIPQKGSDDLQSLNAAEMLQKTLKAYILFGIEPELDCAYGVNSINILGKSELVIAFTAFESELLMEYADILLPIAVPQESGGTYVNVTGDCQQFNKISTIVGESKPAVKILTKIANDFGWNFSRDEEFIEVVKQQINQLKYNNSVKITEEIDNYKLYINYLLNNMQNNIQNNMQKLSKLIRIAPISLYAVDPIIRRSNSLQETLDAKVQVLINPKSAGYLNLCDNQLIIIKSCNNKIFQFPVKISHNIPEGCILINQINIKTVVSIPYQQIVIEKATIDNAYV
ncbi:MAG: molybdopterin-dependent oxidoreductase, partial [Gammaproteobacteria bacterium]